MLQHPRRISSSPKKAEKIRPFPHTGPKVSHEKKFLTFKLIIYASEIFSPSVDLSPNVAKMPESAESLQNIPAFLPYEAKQALLRELSRKVPVERQDLSDLESLNKAAQVLEEMEQAQDLTRNPHFFYGNAPVMEFNLANGDSGSVGQTPRK